MGLFFISHDVEHPHLTEGIAPSSHYKWGSLL